MFCLTKGEISVHYAEYRLSVSCPHCPNSTGFWGFSRIFLEEGIIHGILGFPLHLVMK